jgi:hypothetical protein
VRGRDLANENLETFCLGFTSRPLAIRGVKQALFCRYNADALHAFTSSLLSLDTRDSVLREADLDRSPERITSAADPDG